MSKNRATKAKEETEQENFMLSGKLSEIPWKARTEAQVSKDLFKFVDPDKMIDAYERQLGISVKEPVAEKTQLYKCVFLNPASSDEDRLLLQKFYNSPEKYQVLHRSDNWTPRGEINIFLEYMENIEPESQPNTTTE